LNTTYFNVPENELSLNLGATAWLVWRLHGMRAASRQAQAEAIAQGHNVSGGSANAVEYNGATKAIRMGNGGDRRHVSVGITEING